MQDWGSEGVLKDEEALCLDATFYGNVCRFVKHRWAEWNGKYRDDIQRFIKVYLKDTDERACAYIAGPAPNRWGFSAEGEDLFELINSSVIDDK
ncbi:hypothetical protein J5N97_008351 [Dioscorea zingiberensis]|uniref:Uncharacterized protein n=1 Tax=Dioscorea zingiberensis TaxID=325984 RepID=A0A9D5CUZ4_9LILI|nr:hypothetical protein J5N97_008351 [Dioscorea zingiberensis]